MPLPDAITIDLAPFRRIGSSRPRVGMEMLSWMVKGACVETRSSGLAFGRWNYVLVADEVDVFG